MLPPVRMDAGDRAALADLRPGLTALVGAADTGSAVRGAAIDLWFPTLAQARAWGRRTVTITLH